MKQHAPLKAKKWDCKRTFRTWTLHEIAIHGFDIKLQWCAWFLSSNDKTWDWHGHGKWHQQCWSDSRVILHCLPWLIIVIFIPVGVCTPKIPWHRLRIIEPCYISLRPRCTHYDAHYKYIPSKTCFLGLIWGWSYHTYPAISPNYPVNKPECSFDCWVSNIVFQLHFSAKVSWCSCTSWPSLTCRSQIWWSADFISGDPIFQTTVSGKVLCD